MKNCLDYKKDTENIEKWSLKKIYGMKGIDINEKMERKQAIRALRKNAV